MNFTVIVAGAIENFDQESFSTRLAALIPGVTENDIALTVTVGSVQVNGLIFVVSDAVAREVAAMIANGLLDGLLGHSLNVTIQSFIMPTISNTIVSVATPSSPAPIMMPLAPIMPPPGIPLLGIGTGSINLSTEDVQGSLFPMLLGIAGALALLGCLIAYVMVRRVRLKRRSAKSKARDAMTQDLDTGSPSTAARVVDSSLDSIAEGSSLPMATLPTADNEMDRAVVAHSTAIVSTHIEEDVFSRGCPRHGQESTDHGAALAVADGILGTFHAPTTGAIEVHGIVENENTIVPESEHENEPQLTNTSEPTGRVIRQTLSASAHHNPHLARMQLEEIARNEPAKRFASPPAILRARRSNGQQFARKLLTPPRSEGRLCQSDYPGSGMGATSIVHVVFDETVVGPSSPSRSALGTPASSSFGVHQQTQFDDLNASEIQSSDVRNVEPGLPASVRRWMMLSPTQSNATDSPRSSVGISPEGQQRSHGLSSPRPTLPSTPDSQSKRLPRCQSPARSDTKSSSPKSPSRGSLHSPTSSGMRGATRGRAGIRDAIRRSPSAVAQHEDSALSVARDDAVSDSGAEAAKEIVFHV